MLGTGAGAEMRHSLGTAVFSGMIGVTAFGILLTPVFFYVVMRFKRNRGTQPKRCHRALRRDVPIAGG